MRQKRLFAEPQQHDIQEPSLVAERSLFRHGRGAGRDHDGGRRTAVRVPALGSGLIAGGEPSPVFQASEHDFGAVSASLAALVVADGFGPGFGARDAGRDAFACKASSKPVCVKAPVAQQPLRLVRLSKRAAMPV